MAINFYKIEEADWGSDEKVYPSLDGFSLNEGKEYFDNDLIEIFKCVDNPPVFDHFSMISISEKGAYDWILLDVYGFAGQCYPSIRGWCISKRFKELLESFSIGEPFRFYPAKVMFQGEKYDYYIFQLAYDEKEHTVFNKCTYQYIKHYPDSGYLEVDLKINSKEEFKNGKGLIEGKDVITKHTVLDKYYDLFWTKGSMMTISEDLKLAIEKENISGLKVTPIDYMDFEFLGRSSETTTR